jgi:CSLREA domain-containing protein
MRTTSFSSVSYRFLAALAVIAMVLAALPVMPAYAASITVETTVDELTADGNCSLREAVINSNNNFATHPDCTAGSNAAVDVITLTGGQTYTLSLTGVSASQTGDLDLSDTAGLTIQSSNTTQAIITANGIDRVLDVAATGGNVTLNYITLTNGAPTSGTTGGGINFGSNGTLNITNSVISNNTAPSTTSCGAGLFNNTAATVNITNSTFENNDCTAAGADGGGIFKGTGGILNISNSTFLGNDAAENGGAAHFSPSTVNITNSTFFNNTADKGGAIQTGGATVTVDFSTFSGNVATSALTNRGGAIQVSTGTVAINRSILANSTGHDCDETTDGLTTITNSLVEDQFDCNGTPTSTQDPDLGALANNGGQTLTMAIGDDSPAHDAALSCNSVATDQRGVTRPQGNACDLGAFEVATDPTVLSIVAASPNPTSAATVDYTVTFSEPVTGVGPSDFSLNLSGVVGATVTAVAPVSGPASVYTVTVNTGNGSGTLQLRVPSSASILDDDNNSLANLPFNTGDTYNVTKDPTAPGAASLISPSGTINDSTPDFSWDAVFGATWYYLWVNAPSGNGFIQQWYSAADAGCPSGTGTCTVTSPKTLSGGAHTWWIRTWNSQGYGPWSDPGLNFNVSLPTAPGVATQVSPSGAITDTRPTYTWNAVSGVTWYYLWVKRPSGDPIKQWYEASVICSGGTCSIEHPVDLSAGQHTWWVQTWNAGGFGPWSAGLTFTVNAPGVATLVSPNGNTNDITPTYTWNAVPGATWYYLWVNAPSGNGFIQLWYTAAQAGCPNGTGSCSVTPAQNHALGAHTWWIRTWSSAGYGPWSNAMNFSVIP